jgi:hypothetical protein
MYTPVEEMLAYLSPALANKSEGQIHLGIPRGGQRSPWGRGKRTLPANISSGMTTMIPYLGAGGRGLSTHGICGAKIARQECLLVVTEVESAKPRRHSGHVIYSLSGTEISFTERFSPETIT